MLNTTMILRQFFSSPLVGISSPSCCQNVSLRFIITSRPLQRLKQVSSLRASRHLVNLVSRFPTPFEIPILKPYLTNCSSKQNRKRGTQRRKKLIKYSLSVHEVCRHSRSSSSTLINNADRLAMHLGRLYKPISMHKSERYHEHQGRYDTFGQ